MFKYEYDQLPDALNVFFCVKNRSVHNYKLRPAIAKHAYRDRDFLTCWCPCLELYM